MRTLFTLAGIAFLTALPARTQTFEVTSIKPNLSSSFSSTENSSHGRLTATNISAQDLIRFAFHVRDFQIVGGPGWMSSDHWDISAKTDPSVETDEQFQPPLQALLADRFQLRFHHETRQFSVYSLVVAKNGPKLVAHKGEGVFSSSSSGHNGKIRLEQSKATAKNIADALTRNLREPVIDKTGLTGEYDFAIEWSADQTDTAEASIFTAVQELGLRLEATKTPIDVIVIDSIEKPSEN